MAPIALSMRIPVIQGVIKRRILVNYRADPMVVQRLLPSPFRTKLHNDQGIEGICLIELEHICPTVDISGNIVERCRLRRNWEMT